MRNIADYLVYLLVRILICLVQAMRYETCRFLIGGIVFLFADVLRLRRKLVLANLRNAFPEWTEERCEEAMRQMWEHLLLLAVEVAHTPRKIHDTNWRDHISLHGTHRLLAQLHRKDKPVVIVTGHFGNFEVGGYLLGLMGYPSHAVARTLDNPYLDSYVQGFREATGQYLIAKKGGAEEVVDAMNHRKVVAFLADQADSARKGLWVDFFGRPASTFKSIALVVLQYEAAIAICYSTRIEGAPLCFDLKVSAVLDMEDAPAESAGPKELTQWYTKRLEDGIREQPGQYWWVHNRWKNSENAPQARKR